MNNQELILERKRKFAKNNHAAFSAGPYADPNNELLKLDTIKLLTLPTKPKVSIVIYCYNVDLIYLDRCINSIRNQSIGYNNIEIILVENGSNCLTYNDSNIYVVHTEKKMKDGIIKNMAISNVIGEYVTFMNSNDYYDNNRILEDVYNVLAKEHADILIGTNNIEDPLLYKQFNENYYKVYNCVNVASQIFLYNHNITLGSKFFSTSFLNSNKILFIEYSSIEDLLFYISSITSANSTILYKHEIYTLGIDNPLEKIIDFDYINELIKAMIYKYKTLILHDIDISKMHNDIDMIILDMLSIKKLLKKLVKIIYTNINELIYLLWMYDIPTKYNILYEHVRNNNFESFYKEYKKIKEN